MLGTPPPFLPKNQVSLYRKFSFLLFLSAFFLFLWLLQTFLFPYSEYNFNFNNPDASSNALFSPHNNSFETIDKGKVYEGNTLSLYGTNWNTIESATLSVAPTKKTSLDLQGSTVTVARGIAAAFFPKNNTSLSFSKESIVSHKGIFYRKESSSLTRFVSIEAAMSIKPVTEILELSDDEFSRFPVNEDLIGYRPGTLISYADGVFVVTPENTIRPFANPETLLRMGYTFEHVLKVSGEDVGIYKRGKMIFPGTLHPAGTLLRDTDTDTLYLFTGKSLESLDSSYGDFLKKTNDVILFSSKEEQQSVSCILQKKLLQKSYSCKADLTPLAQPSFSAPDFQFTLSGLKTDGDITSFEVGLQTSRQKENAKAVSQVLWQSILQRFGITQK